MKTQPEPGEGASDRLSLPLKTAPLQVPLVYPPVGLPACRLPETLAEPSALPDTICSPREWGPCQLQRLDSWHGALEPWSQGTLASPTSGGESSSLTDWDG